MRPDSPGKSRNRAPASRSTAADAGRFGGCRWGPRRRRGPPRRRCRPSGGGWPTSSRLAVTLAEAPPAGSRRDAAADACRAQRRHRLAAALFEVDEGDLFRPGRRRHHRPAEPGQLAPDRGGIGREIRAGWRPPCRTARSRSARAPPARRGGSGRRRRRRCGLSLPPPLAQAASAAARRRGALRRKAVFIPAPLV